MGAIMPGKLHLSICASFTATLDRVQCVVQNGPYRRSRHYAGFPQPRALNRGNHPVQVSMSDQIVNPAIAAYLDAARIPLRLACDTHSGWPFVLSLWFLHEEGRLFCATTASARVVSYLQREPRCAFEVAADDPPYCGVRGQALARIDPARGEEILRRLLARYLGGDNSALARRLLARAHEEVAIVLTPVNLFTWNFSRRMQDVAPLRTKPCPPEA